MADGWISLNRSIQDHWVWKEFPFSYGQAWVDLLLLANYEDKKATCKGKIVVCKRGDVNLSFLYLAERWHWSTWKVRNFISLLEQDGMVTTERTTHRTTITIVNYGFYQVSPTTKRTTNCTTDHTTNHQQTTTTNKDNKDNKEINNILSDIVGYLNEKCGTNYKASSDKTKRCINARLNEGFKIDDFKTVIDKKCASWLHNEKMVQYLRPETLFGTKFESYLNEKIVTGKKANQFNEMIHTEYDFDALERKLLGD